MAGLQGAGKTTTVGKLARFLGRAQEENGAGGVCRRLSSCGDQAARDAGRRSRRDLLPPTPARNRWISLRPRSAKLLKFIDVVLVDTAGRLAIDAEMMAEIQAVHAAIKPAETLFVVDAMTGQDAANTARAFGDALPLTGVVLTKVDGDARGGAALSVRHVTGKPICPRHG